MRMKVNASDNAPSVINVYRLGGFFRMESTAIHGGNVTYHPMFSLRAQVSGVASVGQLKLAKNTQAMRETMSWPRFHQAERAVRSH